MKLNSIKRNSLYTPIGLSLMLLGTSSVSAALVVELGDYGPLDIDMNAVALGTAGDGWAGAWSLGTAANRAKYESSASLSYTATGYDDASDVGGRIERANNSGIHEREFTTAFSDSEVWISSLALASRSDGRSNTKIGFISDLGTDVLFGFEDSGVVLNGTENQAVVSIGGNQTLGLNGYSTATHLFLVKISFNVSGVNDRIDFWIDPDVSNVALSGEASLGASNIFVDDVNFGDSISSAKFSLSLPTSAFDAYRIDGGTTGLVNVVPEPSTYAALLGLLSLGFVAFRRSRRN